jgi:hypothetical protein
LNIIKLLSGILGATLLMCMDFYQEWGFWESLPKLLWVLVGFAFLMFSVFSPASNGKMVHFYIEAFVMAYLVALILILPLFGGTSSVGFNANEPFLWIVILLTVWQLNSYRKRIVKQQKDGEKS